MDFKMIKWIIIIWDFTLICSGLWSLGFGYNKSWGRNTSNTFMRSEMKITILDKWNVRKKHIMFSPTLPPPRYHLDICETLY